MGAHEFHSSGAIFVTEMFGNVHGFVLFRAFTHHSTRRIAQDFPVLLCVPCGELILPPSRLRRNGEPTAIHAFEDSIAAAL